MRREFNMPTANIASIQFLPVSREDIAFDSNCSIINTEQYVKQEPQPGGLYDLHMGTMILANCKTCLLDSTECVGHLGSMIFEYPFYNIVTLAALKSWLKVICFNCKQLIIDPGRVSKIGAAKRMATLASKASSSSSNGPKHKICPHCNAIKPIIVRETGFKTAFTLKYMTDKNASISVPIFPHNVDEIFSGVSYDIISTLNLHPNHHPRNYVLFQHLMPPPNLRPDNAASSSSEQNGSPELTHLMTAIFQNGNKISRHESMGVFKSLPYAELFRASSSIRAAQIAQEINTQLTQPALTSLVTFIKAFGMWNYTLVRNSKNSSSNQNQLKIHNSSGSSNSLASLIPSKYGLVRKSLLGVRTDNVFRDVITGDSQTPLDYIKIPKYIAMICKRREVVRPYNYQRLLAVFTNGCLGKYPGCSLLERNGKKYYIAKYEKTTFKLEYGDVLYRDLIDGDWVYFNRQPSFTESSITAMRIIVNHDETNSSIAFNANICAFFNADFDGDNMQGGIVTSAAALAEMKYLLSASAHLISPQTSLMQLGPIQDATIGAYCLTLASARYSKYHAMQMYNTMREIVELPGDRPFSGRELASSIIPPKINYKQVPAAVKAPLNKYIPHDESDKLVLIENGILKSGILDGGSIAAGVFNSLNHTINREYGAQRTLDFMFNLQQLSLHAADGHGITASPADSYINPFARRLVEQVTSAALTRAQVHIDKLVTNSFVTPLNVTTTAHLEAVMINALTTDYTEAALSGLNPDSSLIQLIASKAKGKLIHLQMTTGAVGQSLINGKRLPKSLSYKRTLPYTTKYSLDPEDDGFITNSYVDGLTLKQILISAMSDRFNLITKSLTTAISGTSSRNGIKSLESSIVSYIFRLVLKNTKVYQFTYGINNYDCKQVEPVELAHVILADDEFIAKYKPKGGLESDPVFLAEYNQILADRNNFRTGWLKQEIMAMQPMTNNKIQVPIHARHILMTLTVNSKKTVSTSVSADQLRQMVLMLQEYCGETIQRSMFAKTYSQPIPTFVSRAFETTRMHLREVLNSQGGHLSELTPELLTKLLDIYTIYIKNAFVQPGAAVGVQAGQCIAEPITQYNLNATHGTASGGTSKKGLGRIDDLMRVREINNATMMVYLKPEVEKDPRAIAEIISQIEMLSFNQITILRQIFYEKFGKPTYPAYTHEADMIANFVKLNILTPPPFNLSSWCMRFELNKPMMILKKISLIEIVRALTKAFPALYPVYNSENARVIVLRLYTSQLSETSKFTQATAYYNQIMGVHIRGIKGVRSASTMPMGKMMRNPTSGKVEMMERTVIYTAGSNIIEMMGIPGVEIESIQSDSITEMERVYGIEVAAQKLMNELRGLVPDANIQHLNTYVSEMCVSGSLTGLVRAGVEAREKENTLLRMCYVFPIQNLENAMMSTIVSKIYGISAFMFLGHPPKCGTLAAKVVEPLQLQSSGDDNQDADVIEMNAGILDEF
jgi:DNA-directed RNA polymerase II subunit RPB1